MKINFKTIALIMGFMSFGTGAHAEFKFSGIKYDLEMSDTSLNLSATFSNVAGS